MTRLVPPELEPAWRAVPALADLAARAFGTPVARIRFVGAIWRSPMAATLAIGLAFLRLTGRLVAIDRHAMLTLTPVGPTPSRIRHRLVAAAVGLAAGLPIAMVAFGVYVVLEAGLGRTAADTVLLLMAVAVVVELVPSVVRVVRHRGRVTGVADRLGAEGGAVFEAGMAAAWPRGQGHFSRLRDAAAAAGAARNITVVADARDDYAAAIYRRAGFVPYQQGDSLLLRWPPPDSGTL